MAVTVLLGKMSASWRRLDSILETARLKHTMILTNPGLLMVKILEMVPAVPHGNFTLTEAFECKKTGILTFVRTKSSHQRIMKHLQKTSSLRQDIACCVRIRYRGVGQWLCDFWVNFRRITAAKQQWLHVGPDQVLNCNAKLLPVMQG